MKCATKDCERERASDDHNWCCSECAYGDGDRHTVGCAIRQVGTGSPADRSVRVVNSAESDRRAGYFDGLLGRPRTMIGRSVYAEGYAAGQKEAGR